MSETDASTIFTICPGDTETLARFIGTTGSPAVEIGLRALACAWPEDMQAFINAELNRKDASAIDLMKALNEHFLSVMASVCAQTLKEAGDEVLLKLIVDKYRRDFCDRAKFIRADVQGRQS